MKKIKIDNIEYELIENDRNCFNQEEFTNKCTDYFYPYDYIFGDYSYDGLRLKGFYESNNELATKINDVKRLEEYKTNYCSFGAKTFLLKKVIKKL